MIENPPAPVALLSNQAQRFLRQYKSVPQTLAANNIPAIGAVTGNVAAGVTRESSNGAEGYVRVVPQANAQAAGSIALVFPSTPGTLFVAAEGAFGPVTQATVGNTVTISWTAAAFPGAGSGKAFRIRYEQATSD